VLRQETPARVVAGGPMREGEKATHLEWWRAISWGTKRRTRGVVACEPSLLVMVVLAQRMTTVLGRSTSLAVVLEIQMSLAGERTPANHQVAQTTKDGERWWGGECFAMKQSWEIPTSSVVCYSPDVLVSAFFCRNLAGEKRCGARGRGVLAAEIRMGMH